MSPTAPPASPPPGLPRPDPIPEPKPDPAAEAKAQLKAVLLSCVTSSVSFVPKAGAAVVFVLKALVALIPQGTLGFLMLCVSLILIVSGLQTLHEDLAMPLHKTGNPLFTGLGGFHETRRLTGGHLLAVVMFVLTSIALELMVFFAGDARPASVWTMIGYSAGGLLVLADLVCFWMGLRWSGSVGGSWVAATVLSAVYLAMMVLIALLSNMLIAQLFRRNDP